MFKLLRIEWLKIRRRPRTWILVGLVILAVLTQAILMKNFMNESDPNWKQTLQQDIQEMQQQMAPDSGMPEMARKEIETNLQLYKYYYENDINPNENNAWKFVGNASNLSMLVGIFACVIAGDIVASEFTWGTVKMLLIRPVSRTKILFAKYTTAVLFGLALFVILFASAYLIGGLFFGFTGADAPHFYVDPQGALQQTTMANNISISFALNFVTILMVVTVAFMIGSMFRSSSMSIALSILLLLLGPNVTGLLSSFSWSKYLLFANTDLMQHIEGSSIYGTNMTFSLTMLAAYFIVFHVISWLMFTKRDVAA